MTSLTHRALRDLMVCLFLLPATLPAQTIGLTLGDGTRVSLASGAKLTVPLNVDLSAAGGATLGSLQAGVTWGIGRLRLDSIRVVGTSGFSLTANTTNVTAGQLTFNAYNPTGLNASGPIANLYFTGGTTAGGTSIGLTPTAAGNLAGETIAGLLTARGLDVCVVAGTWNTTSAKWGDANANGSVNVTDAQQLARYAVGLTVTNVLAVEQRGDVNADGLVDVLDAFLVARFAAGLPAGTRVNTLMSVASDLPPVASVEVSPTSLSVGVGEKRTLLVTPRAADGTSLAGCYKPTWASSQTSVATVSANGLVTAKAVGFATISVSVSGKVALASVLVGNPIQSGTLSPAAVLMPSGGTFALFAHWEDANGIPITGRVETWSSSDPSKAAVSSTGLLTALAPGVTIVTVTSEGKSASSRVTVVASAALTIGASGLRTGQQDNLSKLLDGNLVYIDTFYGNNGADGATLEFAATGFSTGTTLSIRYWNAAEAPGQTITATVEQVDGTGAPIAGTAVVQTWTVGQKDNDNTGPVQQVLVASASRVRLTFSGNRVNGAANNQWGWGVGELRVSATP